MEALMIKLFIIKTKRKQEELIVGKLWWKIFLSVHLLFQMVNTLFSLALCVVLDYANYTFLH